MANVGLICGKPLHSKTAQRKTLEANGFTTLFEVGKDLKNCAEIRRFLVKGDTLGVAAMHVIGETHPTMRDNLAILALKNIQIHDCKLGLRYSAGETAMAASLADAAKFFNRESRAPDPKKSKEWGAEGGKKTALKRKICFNEADRKVWFDLKKYRRNEDARDEIRRLHGEDDRISVESIRRAFGPAGRKAGWPMGRGKD